MAGLDTRIVLVGLPTIAKSLHTDLETLLWVTQGYQIAITIGLLFLGRLTDMFGRVKIYNLGFAVFTVGSGLCFLAQTGEQLIIFRIIQGFGGAMIFLNSVALVTDATPAQELGFTVGINQISFTLGSVLGLTVAGVLIQTVGWRTIFSLNVPVGIFGTLWAHFRLREMAKIESQSRFDYLGFLLFTTSLTTFLVAISLDTMAAISGITAVALYMVSLLLFGLFLYVEPRKSQPLLDMRLFRIRLFSAGNISQFLYALGFGSLSLIMILYFQVIRGFDALTAGVLFLPLDVAFVTFGPISGRLSDRYGTRLFTTLGLGVGTISCLAVGFLLTPTTPLLVIELILITIGVGIGLFSSPNISSIMGSVPPERRGVASAVRATLFNTGNVVSIGLVAYIITTAIPYQVVSGIISGGYTSLIPADSMGFLTGVGRAFFVAAAITFAGMVVASLRGPESKRQGAHAERSTT